MKTRDVQQAGCSCAGPLTLIEPGPENLSEPVATVTADISLADRWGGFKARWGVGRNRYRVVPGLYAMGAPDKDCPVLVTANYKLSFDVLRRELGGLNVWILVLDTHGINVWCAAGKGTFGTDEITRRIRASRLQDRVAHRKVIVPQLGAPGVAGFKVKQQTGFNVVYGPVRARDIKRFLADGMKATPQMRRVEFSMKDRLVLVPEELVETTRYALLFLLILALWQGLRGQLTVQQFLWDSTAFLGALAAGAIAVPVLLPWLPFRSFALKGWLVGLLWAAGISAVSGVGGLRIAGNVLLLPALSAFVALNFTGSTTFTSQTGVNKEIRLFARPMAVSGVLGTLLMMFG